MQVLSFSRYILNKVFEDEGKITYLPMLSGNQTALEGRFSSHCCRGLDRGDTYSLGVSITLNQQVISALSSDSSSYDHREIAKEDASLKHVDWKVFQPHFTKQMVLLKS